MITKVEEFRDKHTVSGNNKGDIHGALSVVMPIQHETTAAAVQRVLPALQMAAQGLRDII